MVRERRGGRAENPTSTSYLDDQASPSPARPLFASPSVAPMRAMRGDPILVSASCALGRSPARRRARCGRDNAGSRLRRCAHLACRRAVDGAARGNVFLGSVRHARRYRCSVPRRARRRLGAPPPEGAGRSSAQLAALWIRARFPGCPSQVFPPVGRLQFWKPKPPEALRRCSAWTTSACYSSGAVVPSAQNFCFSRDATNSRIVSRCSSPSDLPGMLRASSALARSISRTCSSVVLNCTWYCCGPVLGGNSGHDGFARASAGKNDGALTGNQVETPTKLPSSEPAATSSFTSFTSFASFVQSLGRSPGGSSRMVGASDAAYSSQVGLRSGRGSGRSGSIKSGETQPERLQAISLQGRFLRRADGVMHRALDPDVGAVSQRIARQSLAS